MNYSSFRFTRPVAFAVFLVAAAVPAFALKFAAIEHHLKADPSIPAWKPGPVTTIPEEEFNLVGADIMDEITLGWVKLFREAYPKLSVTMEARASGSGVPALTEGKAHAAPVGREALPAEHDAFVKKYGYEPFAIKVATGSLGSLGKTATSIVLVAKSNPIKGLTFQQLDQIYSKSHKLGGPDITKWGQLGLTGEWADKPIGVYGFNLRYNTATDFADKVLGASDKWNEKIKAYGHVVQADGTRYIQADQITDNLGKDRYGIAFNRYRGERPKVKRLAIAPKGGGAPVAHTIENIQSRRYPLFNEAYFYTSVPPGTKMNPMVREFLRYMLSQEGQAEIQRDGKYLPLTAEVVREQLKKLE